MAPIPKATTKPPDVLEWKPSWTILAGIALAGIVLIAYVHNFQGSPSVLFLSFGWVSILGAGAFLWQAGLLVAAGDDGDESSFIHKRTRVDDLQAEKASLLKAIKEVEFDHAMGKMSDFDAKQITNVYRRRALVILKELDVRLARQTDVVEDEVLTVAERIERDIRARSTLARADAKARDRARKQDKVVAKIDIDDDARVAALESLQKKMAADETGEEE